MIPAIRTTLSPPSWRPSRSPARRARPPRGRSGPRPRPPPPPHRPTSRRRRRRSPAPVPHAGPREPTTGPDDPGHRQRDGPTATPAPRHHDRARLLLPRQLHRTTPAWCPVLREIPKTQAVGAAAMHALLDGPQRGRAGRAPGDVHGHPRGDAAARPHDRERRRDGRTSRASSTRVAAPPPSSAGWPRSSTR